MNFQKPVATKCNINAEIFMHKVDIVLSIW